MLFLTMNLMSEYIYKLVEEICKDLISCGIVLQLLRKLRRALEHVKIYPELGPAQWDKAQLLKVMDMLTSSEAGTIDYDEACEEISAEVMFLMIKYNVIHFRPTSYLAFDTPAHITPIMTAESPASLVVMKGILSEDAESNNARHRTDVVEHELTVKFLC